MPGVILAPLQPLHKNRPGRDFANCNSSFMHAHGDRCPGTGDKPAVLPGFFLLLKTSRHNLSVIL